MTGPDLSPTVPATPGRRRPRRVALIVVLALIAGAGVAVAGLYAAGTFSTEILAEPITSDGANPFTPPIGEGGPVQRPAGKTGVTVTGDTVGLYGGTLNNAACDPLKLVTYLQQNPDKGAAWAAVLDIAPDGIASYVAGLTPVVLRSDTAVTNHGFANGRATTLNSVLQAGTAVLVDKGGVPRVRCKCGNPLTPAKSYSRPSYEGDKWPEFSPQLVTMVQPAPRPIDVFVIVNLADNRTTIKRPAGTSGERDEGRLEDASIAGRYTLSRRVVQCSGFKFGCSSDPIPVEITCAGATECTLARLDGGWMSTHTLTRSGGTWQTTEPDEGAAFCQPFDGGPNNPVPGTTIEFTLTPTSAAAEGGVWRVTTLNASYTVRSPGVPGTDCPASVADYELMN